MADWKFKEWRNNEEDEKGEATGNPFQNPLDGAIFAIDCTKPMFDRLDEKSAFEDCIKCARDVVHDKVIRGDNEPFGIVLFGTEHSWNPLDIKGIYILHEMGHPGEETVRQLEKLLEGPNNEFEEKFGHASVVSVADLLLICANMFSNCSQTLGFKKIILFTNSDNPHGDRHEAFVMAEKLRQNGIDLELMHLSQSDKSFNVKVFYEQLLNADQEEQTVMADAADSFEELWSRVQAAQHKKQAISSIPLILGEELSIFVEVVSYPSAVQLLKRTIEKPSTVITYEKTFDEKKTFTKSSHEETGEVFMCRDKHKPLAPESEELAQVKLCEEPGFHLMGFTDKELLRPYLHIQPRLLICPDESSMIGSTCLFKAIGRKCIERGVIPVCKYITQKNTPPRLVAFFPQQGELDDHSVQAVPAGFLVGYLPLNEDLRKLNIESDAPLASVIQHKAKELFQKMQLEVGSKSPADVRAWAFDRDTPEQVIDHKDEERIGQLAEEFLKLVFVDGNKPDIKSKADSWSRGEKFEMSNYLERMDFEGETEAGELAMEDQRGVDNFIIGDKTEAGAALPFPHAIPEDANAGKDDAVSRGEMFSMAQLTLLEIMPSLMSQIEDMEAVVSGKKVFMSDIGIDMTNEPAMLRGTRHGPLNSILTEAKQLLASRIQNPAISDSILSSERSDTLMRLIDAYESLSRRNDRKSEPEYLHNRIMWFDELELVLSHPSLHTYVKAEGEFKACLYSISQKRLTRAVFSIDLINSLSRKMEACLVSIKVYLQKVCVNEAGITFQGIHNCLELIESFHKAIQTRVKNHNQLLETRSSTVLHAFLQLPSKSRMKALRDHDKLIKSEVIKSASDMAKGGLELSSFAMNYLQFFTPHRAEGDEEATSGTRKVPEAGGCV